MTSPIPGTRPGTGAVADSQAVLDAYRTRTRRLSTAYACVLVLILITVAVLVELAYARGELSHVTSRSAAPPAPIPAAATAAALSLRWRTTDRPASSNPYSNGIVVTFSAHTVNGRDALTGAVRWFYTRSDERICTVIQQDASTIAFYDHHNNCDEITGFNTATGQPKFYRTAPDNGVPAVTSASNIVVVLTPAAVHVFDNAGGIDRWTWSPPAGCVADRALSGASGVLVSFHCANSFQLMLHSVTEDSVLWTTTIPTDLIPISVDATVGAVNPTTGLVSTFSVDKGAPGRSFSLGTPNSLGLSQLPVAAANVAVSTSTATDAREFVWPGRLISILSSGQLGWSAATTGPPTVTATGDALVSVTEHGVSVLAPDTGKTTKLVALPQAPTAGSRAYLVGSGVLIAGTETSYYG